MSDRTLVAKGLYETTPKEGIQYMFSAYGRCKVYYEKNNCYIVYDQYEDAKDACAKLDGSKLRDRRISVSFLKNHLEALNNSSMPHSVPAMLYVYTPETTNIPLKDLKSNLGRYGVILNSQRDGKYYTFEFEDCRDAKDALKVGDHFYKYHTMHISLTPFARDTKVHIEKVLVSGLNSAKMDDIVGIFPKDVKINSITAKLIFEVEVETTTPIKDMFLVDSKTSIIEVRKY